MSNQVMETIDTIQVIDTVIDTVQVLDPAEVECLLTMVADVVARVVQGSGQGDADDVDAK